MKDWNKPRVVIPPRGASAAIMEAVRARGATPRDLREAAHEACHALELGVRVGAWDWASIDLMIRLVPNDRAARFLRSSRRNMVVGPGMYEITARTVERLVCARLGVDAGDPADLARTAVVEAARHGVQFESVEWFLEAVEHESYTAHARGLADRVMLLAPAFERVVLGNQLRATGVK